MVRHREEFDFLPDKKNNTPHHEHPKKTQMNHHIIHPFFQEIQNQNPQSYRICFSQSRKMLRKPVYIGPKKAKNHQFCSQNIRNPSKNPMKMPKKNITSSELARKHQKTQKKWQVFRKKKTKRQVLHHRRQGFLPDVRRILEAHELHRRCRARREAAQHRRLQASRVQRKGRRLVWEVLD